MRVTYNHNEIKFKRMNKNICFLFILICSIVYSAKVDTVAIESKALNRQVKVVVIKPEQYKKEGNSMPVLYLLHGAYGDYSDWVKKVPEVKVLSDLYNIIVVCPDGSYNSWYFDSPIDSKMLYESYIAKDLVSWVDANLNTIKNKKGRAITGLSMGGHGALYLCFKHQDIWGAVGSMSGAVDFRPFCDNYDIKIRIGTYAQNQEVWEKNTVTNMLYLLNGDLPKIYFDCGNEDFLYNENKILHQKMLDRRIPHEYTERPGGHTWEYWVNSIKYHFLFFNDFFNRKK